MAVEPTDPTIPHHTGWRRRFIADPVRAEEAVQCYQQMGFEVLLETVKPEDLGPECQNCTSPLCPSYQLIYTRQPAEGRQK